MRPSFTKEQNDQYKIFLKIHDKGWDVKFFLPGFIINECYAFRCNNNPKEKILIYGIRNALHYLDKWGDRHDWYYLTHDSVYYYFPNEPRTIALFLEHHFPELLERLGNPERVIFDSELNLFLNYDEKYAVVKKNQDDQYRMFSKFISQGCKDMEVFLPCKKFEGSDSIWFIFPQKDNPEKNHIICGSKQDKWYSIPQKDNPEKKLFKYGKKDAFYYLDKKGERYYWYYIQHKGKYYFFPSEPSIQAEFVKTYFPDIYENLGYPKKVSYDPKSEKFINYYFDYFFVNQSEYSDLFENFPKYKMIHPVCPFTDETYSIFHQSADYTSSIVN